jgi:membrane protein implicated in regulation of membrane protease activity
VSSTSKRAGWWAWGPAIYGVFFFILGIVIVAGGAAVPAASGALYGTGGIFLVMGIGALAFAWYVSRDIKSDDGPTRLPGEIALGDEQFLRATGVPGSAKVNGFKFVGRSHEGTTLVELQVDVTTTRGGTAAITKQARVPLAATQKLAVGATVPCTVSATDPNQLLFDWTALVTV